jgi:HSP20 family molecular chaperone IbpA
MKARLPVHKTESIFDEVEKIHQRIEKRAYELFESRGGERGHDVDDWLAAEREVIWSPPISMEEHDGQITVQLSARGFGPENIDVELTPEDLLVEAETHEERAKTKGRARMKEVHAETLFRSVHFSRAVDPDSAEAELKNGILTITAKLAREAQSEPALA